MTFAVILTGWPDAGCPGCSLVADQIAHLSHLHARDTSFVMVSRAPLANIERYKTRMGWTHPWYSSAGSDFNTDFGLLKTTRVNQRVGVQFRAEAFNVFNNVNFQLPNNNVSSAQFGQITAVIDDSQRIIQLGVKLIF